MERVSEFIMPVQAWYSSVATKFGFQGKMMDTRESPLKIVHRHPSKGGAPDEDKEKVVQEQIGAVTMPRIIPACSKEKLDQQIAKAPNLFGENKVGGLIAGKANSLLDARLVVWGAGNDNAWNFKFKSCSDGYSMGMGATDLKEKMGDNAMANLEKELCDLPAPRSSALGPSKAKKLKLNKGEEKKLHKQQKKRSDLTNKLASKQVERSCHGMLVGIKETGKPSAHIWIINEEGNKFLRIVMVFPCNAPY